jgi:hypothetical protein
MIKGRLTAKDFNALRQTATQQALFQRRACDLVQHHQLDRSFTQRYIGMAGGKARQSARTPHRFCSCGLVISMKRVREGKDKCFKCGLKKEQSMGLGL